MPDFRAAIFDLDGTLIDSMDVWKKIAKDFLKNRFLNLPKNYISTITPMSFPEAAEYTISLFHLSESANGIVSEWYRMAVYEYSHNIRLKPHVKEYLLYLKGLGVRLAVATASPRVLYEPVLKNNGVYGLFDAFASTDEVSKGKSHPDVYLLAASRLNVPPADCVVFEDIYTGILGAKAAGMKAYGVYDKSSAHDKAKIMAVADGYIHDFSELIGMPGVK